MTDGSSNSCSLAGNSVLIFRSENTVHLRTSVCNVRVQAPKCAAPSAKRCDPELRPAAQLYESPAAGHAAPMGKAGPHLGGIFSSWYADSE